MGTNFTDIEPTDPVIAATINDRLDQLDAAIQAGIGGIILTNKSGGALAANDAVVVDGANDEAVTTTTSAGNTNRPGVVIAGGANNAEVTVSLLGEVTVVVDGAGSRGDWIKTSTTAKQVTPVATLDEGVFGILVTASSGGAGTTATALLLGAVVVEPPAHTHAAADIITGLLALARGGTGADLSATGPGYLKQAGAGAAVTVGAIAAGDLPAATTSAQGAVELATDGETQTGTDPDRAVTPAGAASAYIAQGLLTTKGDIIARDGSGPARLGVGSDAQVLAADSAETTGLKWVPQVAGGSGIPGSTIDAKGDLIAGTADDTYSRLGVGADGQGLRADSGQSTGLAWAYLLQSNLLINGAFDHWQRSTDDTGVTTTRKYVADRWAFTTGAGTLAHVQRSTTVRSGARSRYSCQLDGAASVTTVDVDQRLEAALSGLYKTTVSFSAWVYNGSGSAFTPKLFVSTPAAADDWSSPTVRNGGGSGEDLQECADSGWTNVTWSADVSGYTNIDNGLEVRLQIPSGSLVASDTVRLAEMNLVASTLPLPLLASRPELELASCQRFYYKTYNQVVVPGSVSSPGAINFRTRNAINASTSGFLIAGGGFPVKMRSAPNVTIYSGLSTGTANAVRNVNGPNDRTGATATDVGDGGFRLISIDNSSANAIALDDIIAYHFVAESEL